ncbi:MAG: PASTA domain-containing protein [Methanosarcina sp.]
MKEQLEQRLIELRNEYQSGQKILKDIELKLSELEDRKSVLSETLIRISGAIDILEEVLGKEEETQEEEVKSGLPADVVEVPDLIRQPLEKAKNILEEAGLTVGEVVEQKGVLPVGIMVGDVLKQEPKKGTKLPPKAPVKLVIASRSKFFPQDKKKSYCGAFSE